jgi:hypothetical protein
VLECRWSAWFEGLRITGDELGQTIIVSPVVDRRPYTACPPRSGSWASRRSEMNLLAVLVLLIALDLAAWRWGHDSRDGRDWTPRR